MGNTDRFEEWINADLDVSGLEEASDFSENFDKVDELLKKFQNHSPEALIEYVSVLQSHIAHRLHYESDGTRAALLALVIWQKYLDDLFPPSGGVPV